MLNWAPLLILFLTGASAQSAESRRDPAPTLERTDRLSDQAALSIHLRAAKKYETLVLRYKDKPNELAMLMRLADVLQKSGDLAFRVAYQSERPVSTETSAERIAVYEDTLVRECKTLDRVISNYVDSSDAPRAYYLRGTTRKAQKDLGGAFSDFKTLVDLFPSGALVVPATLHLAEIAAAKKQYSLAIHYLEKLRISAQSDHFNHVMEKLGECYFQLGNIPQALAYTERRIASIHHSKLNPKTLELELQRALATAAFYYARGYEVHLAGFTITSALAYFKKIEPGPQQGYSLLAFAFQLRVREYESDLLEWNRLVQTLQPTFAEQADIFYTTLEYQIGKRQYEQVTFTLNEYTRTASYQSLSSDHRLYGKLKRLLLKAAETLIAVAAKTSRPQDVETTQRSVTMLYGLVLRVSLPTDPELPRIHFNLAETWYNLHDFEQATLHYRWVVDRGQKKRDQKLISDSMPKAIAARYESLRKAGLIPQALVPRAPGLMANQALPATLAEWISWIDLSKKNKISSSSIDSFEFEANRALYAQNRIEDALHRLETFVSQNPESKYAIPSAALILDTWIAAQDWEQVEEQAKTFLEVANWRDSLFATKLVEIGADAAIKQTESLYKNQQYAQALDKAQSVMANYPKSAHLNQAITIAGGCALELKNNELALSYLNRLIDGVPLTEANAPALATRARLLEGDLDFSGAARDYRALIQAGSNPKPEDRARALHLAWLAGDQGRALESALRSPQICDPTQRALCDRFSLIKKLGQSDLKVSTNDAIQAFKVARRHAEPQRFLLSAYGLESRPVLYYSDALDLITWVAQSWEKEDALVKLSLLPRLNQSIPRAFAAARHQIHQLSPIHLDEVSIRKRVEMIKRFETAATEAMKLPWKRIRAVALVELAQLYRETYASLKSQAPSMPLLAEPFLQKSLELVRNVSDLTAHSSIEDSAMDSFQVLSLSLNFRREDPFPSYLTLILPPSLESGMLQNFAEFVEKSPTKRWEERWRLALARSNWPEVWALLRSARTQSILDSHTTLVARAISLSQAGARSEAMEELIEILPTYTDSRFAPIQYALLTSYFRTLSKAPLRTSLEYFRQNLSLLPQLDLEHEVTIQLAAHWLNEPFPKSERDRLAERIREVPSAQRRPLVRAYFDQVINPTPVLSRR